MEVEHFLVENRAMNEQAEDHCHSCQTKGLFRFAAEDVPEPIEALSYEVE